MPDGARVIERGSKVNVNKIKIVTPLSQAPVTRLKNVSFFEQKGEKMEKDLKRGQKRHGKTR